MVKVNCIDCIHINRKFSNYDYYSSDYCAKYTHKGSVPYQNTEYADDIHTAWKRCKGASFEARPKIKGWFKWLK